MFAILKGLFNAEMRIIASLFVDNFRISCVPILLIMVSLFNCQKANAEDINSVKVAICQIQGIDSDREGNFKRIENALIEAKEKKAAIACFPETIILGWVNPNAHQEAQPIPGSDSDRLCSLAKQYQIFISVGLAEKSGEKLFDSVLLIDDNGKILLKHRKINILDWLMDPPYISGNSINVVETKYGRIGLLICADTFTFEPWTNNLEKMAELEPDLVLVPYGWAKPPEHWPDTGDELAEVVKEAAQGIGAPVIGTNLVGMISNGPWTGWIYGGLSVASDSNGKIIATCKDRDREIKVVPIKIE